MNNFEYCIELFEQFLNNMLTNLDSFVIMSKDFL